MTKLLLVSNDELSCQILEEGLKIHNYDVVTADQGDEGLILATTASPDLILLDLDVPVVNGFQAIKVLRESEATQLIPVIAIADRTIADAQVLTQAGFDTYIRKPVSVRHLLMRIDVLLDDISMVQMVQMALDRRPFELPSLSPSAMAPETPACQKTSDQPMVVYVDDSLADSAVMADIVQSLGCDYALISDGLYALTQLLELQPQLIFLASGMSLINGYELCAQIRRIPGHQKTPVIIVTNNNEVGDRIRSKVVGASGFLSKPIEASRTLKILMKHLPLFRV